MPSPCSFFFLLSAVTVQGIAQIKDSLNKPAPITTVSTNPYDSLIGRVDSTISQPSGLGDSLKSKGIAPWTNRQIELIKKQLPQINKGDKTTLTIKFFWRDDVTIPYPKGLLKVGAPPPYDPVVAWQRSAMIPGWGQAYNRGYWKIPLFYAGYGAAIWWINYNNQQYVRYGNAYYWTIDGDPATEDTELLALNDATRLREKRNSFRQTRDQAVLIFLGWHVVQIAEAYIDAHLKGFDVSEDLSFKTGPGILQSPSGFGATSLNPGLSLTFTF